MVKKIHSMSPNFLSIISPNIPESLALRWVFAPSKRNETQEKAVVRIYKKNFVSTLLVFNVDDQQEVSIANNIDAFNEEEEYEWDVEITSSNKTVSVSERAPFRFASIEMHGHVEWPDGPESYEFIGSRKYFTEIRENTISIMSDYVLETDSEIDALLELSTIFTGDIVPSERDFATLEKALRIIAEKEYVSKESIYKLVEDGLDASDIHKIYAILSDLSQIPPYQPTNFSLVVDNPPMYGIETAKAVNKNESDTTIQLQWSVEKINESANYILFDDELNNDISFYKLDVITGFEDAIISHPLYYRVKDLNKLGNKIYFQLKHHEYENISKTLKCIYGFNVIAVDKRRHESINYSVIQPAPKMTLGVSHYVLQNEIYSLTGAAAVKPYGEDLYTGVNSRYTHNLSGDISGFYHYRVKAVDKGGEESEWFEFGPVKIDTFIAPKEIIVADTAMDDEDDFDSFFAAPITKPSVAPPPIQKMMNTSEQTIVLEPPKPIVEAVNSDSASIKWKAVKNADMYEISIVDSDKTTETSFTYSDLEENTTYTVMVRSINKDSTSNWSSVSFTTTSKPIMTKEYSPISSKCWRSDYKILYQNGRQAFSKSGWRNDVLNEIILGEWIELYDNINDGFAIKSGTRWGNHKSLILFDAEDLMSSLKDKEIIMVEMYMKRVHTTHGYSNDGKTLYLYTHNYSEFPTEEPQLSNNFIINNQTWSRGKEGWIALPNKFGELLKNGGAKGIALYHPNINLNPPSNYSYCRFDANSIKLKIHYK